VIIAMLSRVRLPQRAFRFPLVTVSTRLSSSKSEIPFPSTKLTQSYYHHISTIPLLYHSIGQHLDQLVETHPNHQCYVFKSEGNKRYTYRSFLDEVDSFATSLIELGFQKNDRIGVWLPNTSENCVATYAASKVGLIKVGHSLCNEVTTTKRGHFR
jgi:non-ribosomal peptide synthetase component E (peptide arylation enzyme)